MTGGPTSDFNAFVLGLASQAMLSLGVMPDPQTNERDVSLPLACQTIEILAMLETKTKGNLDSEEAALLERILYDLRLRYVDCSNKT